MGYRRAAFAPGEWYHCFNRGIDKRVVFESPEDYRRFEQLLYLANDTEPVARDTFYYLPHEEVLSLPRAQPLVAIGGWCLMHNHYHLLLKELVDNGVSRFMHKVGTGYTVYFNLRNDRVGNLFVKPFRSKHVANDRYLRRVLDYIHLNPIEILEPGWKKGKIRNHKSLEQRLRAYGHSSLSDYVSGKRAEGALLDDGSRAFLRHVMPPLDALLKDMSAYYTQVESEFGSNNSRGDAS